MDRLIVYLQSREVGTVDFVDKEGAMHACAQAQSIAFQGLSQLSGIFGNRYLSDEDREALMNIEEFCRENRLKYSIVDVGKMSFAERLSLRMKGIKTPTVCCGEKILQGVPSKRDLQELLDK